MVKKIVLLLIVALALGLWHEGTRPKILGALKPVLDPVFSWSTKSEIKQITRDLETDANRDIALPYPGQFGAWLAEKYRAGGTEDAWGATYYLERYADSVVVGSPGPDGAPGTADDIRVGRVIRRSGRR